MATGLKNASDKMIEKLWQLGWHMLIVIGKIHIL